MPERAARVQDPRVPASGTNPTQTMGPPPPRVPVHLHKLPNRAPTLAAPRASAGSDRPASDELVTRGSKAGWRSVWLAPLAFLLLAATIAVGEAFLSGRGAGAPPAGQDRGASQGPSSVPPGETPSITSPRLKGAPHHGSVGGDSSDLRAPAEGEIGQSEALVDLGPLEAYLAALAQGDYAQARRVSSGPASSYVEYLVALHRVLDDEPPSSSLTLVEPPGPAKELADGYLAVGGRAEFTDHREDFSYVLSDFMLRSDPAGAWTVESYRRDGIDIGALLAVGDPASGAEANDVLISVSHAFLQPAPGEVHTLVLVYRIDNGRAGPVSAFPYGATFQPAQEGSEVEAEFALEEVVVVPQRSAEDLLFVQPGHLNGSVVGELLDVDTKAAWTIEVPLPRPSSGG